MKIELKIENLEKVRAELSKLSGEQASVAYANAITDTAKHVQSHMRKALRAGIDRTTPFIEKSPKYVPATPKNLSAKVLPTIDTRNLPGTGGKVGVDPQDVLQAQEFGGRRRDKRSEAALRRAGILPTGYQTSIPREPYPGSDDGRGNLSGRFLQQLLSYMQAYSESGFKANMTARRKRAVHKGTAKAQGRRYFVSYGRLRGQHLAPGIWAAQGTHGADVRPVLMFVRAATYRPRISMDSIARDSGAQDYLDKRVRFRIRELAEGKLA